MPRNRRPTTTAIDPTVHFFLAVEEAMTKQIRKSVELMSLIDSLMPFSLRFRTAAGVVAVRSYAYEKDIIEGN